MLNKRHLINITLFVAGWGTCLCFGNTVALLTTIVILLIHLKFIGCWQQEKEILLITFLLGCVVDSFAGNLGILEFSTSNRLLPLSMACVWVLAGTTIRHSLRFCSKRPWLAFLTGFAFALIHYALIGVRYGTYLAPDFWQTLLIMSISWSIVLPILMAFSAVWLERYKRNNL